MKLKELDATDKGILTLLQKDARLTHKELAHKLNKSVTPIHIRVRRLQEAGYITQYTAVLDAKKIGKGLTIFAQIQLKEHHKNALTTFMEEATELDEVLECYHMTGKFDFILKIVLSDMDEYRELMMQKLSELPNVGGVAKYICARTG